MRDFIAESLFYLKKHRDMMFLLFPYFWGDSSKIHRKFILSSFLILLTMGLNITLPLVLREVVERLGSSSIDYFNNTIVLLMYGIIWTAGQATSQIREIILYSATERGIRLFTLKLFQHIHALPYKFHLESKTGGMVSDIEMVQIGFPSVFWGFLFIILPTSIEIISASLILWFNYGFLFGIVLMLAFLVFILVTVFGTEISSRARTRSNALNHKVSSFIADSLMNYAAVKQHNNESFESNICDNILAKRETLNVKTLRYLGYVRLIQIIVVGVGLIILTLISGQQVMTNLLHLSDFILINGYLLQFIIPLSLFGLIFRDIRRSLADMENATDILGIKQEEQHHKLRYINPFNTQDKAAHIAFNKVSFSYFKDRPLIDKVSFQVEPGTTLAIIGPSGVGKSTLAHLLLGFFEPDTGDIIINNQSIRYTDKQILRQHIAVVTQDTILFNNTIYYNITYGNPSATKEEVEVVIRALKLDDLINKIPLGYNTFVGERGLKISAGEKQRIALARVMLRKPSIYIFDEVSSSLDYDTESSILQAIKKISTNTSTIIIAHRLSTIEYVDEVVVMNNGKVLERGNHLSLLELRGYYYRLWHQQRLQDGVVS